MRFIAHFLRFRKLNWTIKNAAKQAWKVSRNG